MVFLIYGVLAYWAAGKTVYANKIMFGSWTAIFMQKFITGFVLGIILIPIAIIKTLLGR